MRHLAIPVLVFFFSLSQAFAAGFQDPWESQGKFRDPFATKEKQEPSRKQEAPKRQEKTQEMKKDSGKQARQPGGSMESAPMKPIFRDRREAPKMPGQIARPEAEKPGDWPVEDNGNEEEASEELSWLSPMGIKVGDSWDSARSLAGVSNFSTLGACGKGELFVFDPQGMCALLLLENRIVKQQKLVSGGSFRINPDCVADNPLLSPWLEWLSAAGGKADKSGVERSDNAPSVLGCANVNATLSGDALPKFLGFLTGSMTREMADATLGAMGAKRTKTFSNGASYDLMGTTVFCEFCAATGKPVAFSFRVDRENPRIRNLIDGMNLKRAMITYENARIRAERKDGKVVRAEMVFTEAASQCKKTG